jgi:hypothetical protein
MAGVLFMPSALPVIAHTNRASIATLPYQYTLSDAPTNLNLTQTSVANRYWRLQVSPES